MRAVFVRGSVGQPTGITGISGGLWPGERGLRQMAKRWYSVSVLSNFEKKIAEQIRTAVAEKGLQDEIDEVLETNAEDFVKSYVQKGGQ